MVQGRERENITDDNDNQDIFDDSDPNTWIASAEMEVLPTNIFRKNTLPQPTRKAVLQSEPRNKAISFEPAIMDRKIWTSMPRNKGTR